MEDQRRDLNARQDAADVDLGVHPCQRDGRAGARAHPEVRRPPLAEGRIGGSRRRPLLDADRSAPFIDDLLTERVALFARRPPGVIGIAETPRVAADHDQRFGPFRVRRRKQAAHRAALGHTQQHCPLRSRRLHDGAHVVEPLFERRELTDRHRIGQSGATLVEQDQPRHRREAIQKLCKRWLVPEVLEVRDPAHHEDQIDGTGTDHFVGDVHVAAVRVAHARTHGGERGHERSLRAGGGRLDGAARLDRRDESIAAPMGGLNEPWFVGIVAERAADVANRSFQHGLADEDVRPDGVQQLLLEHEPPGARGQVLQQRERFRGERDGGRAPQQLTAFGVQTKVREGENGLAVHRGARAQIISPARGIPARPTHS